MQYELMYGKSGLSFALPDERTVTVVEPQPQPALPEPYSALRAALQNPIDSPPLRHLAADAAKIGIIVNDITRATPTRLILSAILSEIASVPPENVTIFIALGTHRRNTDAEVTAMLGEEIASRFRVVQNDSADETTQEMIGKSSLGHEIWLNRELTGMDLLILTGFIEPHFFAGFSGGGKAVMPGMAGSRTIFANHSAPMIAHPHASWGITEGNPIWEEAQEIAETAAERLFLVNVALNQEHALNGVFCGGLRQAHCSGSAFVKRSAMAPVEQRFDLVITGNSGYPLDLNLYQAVKGISAAARIVKPGGTILMAAQCSDGIPDHGMFGELLSEIRSPEAFLAEIAAREKTVLDQWQVQILMQVLQTAKVAIYADGLTPMQIERCQLTPVSDLTRFCASFPKDARICVMPQGPLTIPFVR